MAAGRDDALYQPPADIKASRWLTALGGQVRTPVRAAVLVGFLQGLAMIAQAGLIAYIIDRLVMDGASREALTGAFLALLAVFLGRAATVWGIEVLGQRAAAAIKHSLRRAFFQRLAALGPAYSAGYSSGHLVSAGLDQIEKLEGYFARFLPQMGICTVVPLTMVVAAFAADWLVGLILLIAAPFVPVLMTLIGMRAEAASQSQVAALNHLSGYLLDRLQGLVTLKLFGRGRDEVAGVAAASEAFRKRTMAVLRLAFLSSAILEAFAAITIALVAMYVGFALAGYIGFGPASNVGLFTGLFVLLLAPDFFLPLRQLGQYYHDRAEAVGATGPLVNVLSQAPPAGSQGSSSLPLDQALSVSLEGVTARYPDAAAPSLVGLDLQVAPGEAVALVGPSGAGKSTVLDVLLGFIAPEAGTARLGGVALSDLDAASRQGATAWLGQRNHLFAGTLKDNIRLGRPEATDSQIEDAAEAARVSDFAAELDAGLESPVGERGYGLSGGQARRVALARAILKDAPVLLLDEPTAGLDEASAGLVLDALGRLRQGRTVLVVTHSSEAATWTDRQVHLAQGKLAAEGGPA